MKNFFSSYTEEDEKNGLDHELCLFLQLFKILNNEGLPIDSIDRAQSTRLFKTTVDSSARRQKLFTIT